MNHQEDSQSQQGSAKSDKKLKRLDVGKLVNENKLKQAQQSNQILANSLSSMTSTMAQMGLAAPIGFMSAMQAAPATFAAQQPTSYKKPLKHSPLQAKSQPFDGKPKPQPSSQEHVDFQAQQVKQSRSKLLFPYQGLDRYDERSAKNTFSPLKGLNPAKPPQTDRAEFILIRSQTWEDVHKALKYGVWTSSERNNSFIQHAWEEAQKANIPVYLIFAIVEDQEFAGVAEMTSPLDMSEDFLYWFEGHKYRGLLLLKWHYLCDRPFKNLLHIKSDSTPLPLLRDCSRLTPEAGREVISYYANLPERKHCGTILGDFEFMDAREKRIREERDKDDYQMVRNYQPTHNQRETKTVQENRYDSASQTNWGSSQYRQQSRRADDGYGGNYQDQYYSTYNDNYPSSNRYPSNRQQSNQQYEYDRRNNYQGYSNSYRSGY